MISKLTKDIVNTKLETPRLILRPMLIKDLRIIFEIENKHMAFDLIMTKKKMKFQAFANWFKKRKNRVDYVIINKKNNKIIGVINTVFYMNNKILFGELSKYIGLKKFREMGLLTEAAKEWINFIFISTNIQFLIDQNLKKNLYNKNTNLNLGFAILKDKKNQKKSELYSMKLTRKKWELNNEEVLRNIYFSDLKQILTWRNSLKVREISLDSSYISYKKHLEWYQKIQTDTSYFSFLISKDNKPCGIVNLKIIDPKTMQWSIYKKPHSQKGFGTFLAHRVLNKVFSQLNTDYILASINSSNYISIKFHKTLGFKVKKNINKNYSRNNDTRFARKRFFFKNYSNYILNKSDWMKNKDLIHKKIIKTYRI